MRRLPYRVPVKGTWYKVKQVPTNDPVMRSRDTPTYGFCDDNACILYISKELSLQMKWATLFHEWTHAIAAGSKDIDIADNNENAVEYVSGEMLKLFRYLDKTMG